MIPSIDLMGGKVVQLEQGKKVKICLEKRPIEFAKQFSTFQEVQIIDLDAAMGKNNNYTIVKKLCSVVNARVGGGIRTTEKAVELLGAGAKKVIIGTNANKSFLQNLSKKIGKEKIIVAIDSLNGKVAVRGWKKMEQESPIEKATRLQKYCDEFLYTCIEKEGLMQGIDWKTIKKLKSITNNKLSIAGGISGLAEVKKLETLGIKPVVGMAIYTGKIGLSEVK